MRKIILFLLSITLFASLTFAQASSYDKQAAALKEQIAKIRNEITRLKAKQITIASKARQAKIIELIEGHEARVERLVKELGDIERARLQQVREAEQQPSTPAPAAAEEPAEEELSAEETVVEEPLPPTSAEVIAPLPEQGEYLPAAAVPVSQQHRLNFEIGSLAGIYANSTGILGEVRFPMRFVLGPATSSFRFCGGLVQSADMTRRFAPAMVDIILNFPAGYFSGVENYLGGGLNYVVRMTGQTAGTVGGQCFYGIESSGFGGKLFGEIGFGILRSGFSPSHKGTTMLFGYRRDWALF
ncbi:MAG: hypothetical protein JW782_02130 [Candidatus Saganbacteria bacterium]|nr:hypothetical protein [Candidatus Saganbacteria bacterium]